MRIAILLTLLTTTAHAGNNEITVTESARALRTSSANALTEDGLFGVSFGYARQLPLTLGPFEVWGHAAFDIGVTNGTMFQTLTTELDTLGGSAGLRARYVWRQRVVASARVDIGMIRADLEIRDEMGHSASDHGWGATSTAAAGVDLYAVRRERFSLGLRFELGVVATSSIPLAATPARGDENTLELEMTAASLGSLNLSGPSFAASLVGQF